MNVRTASRLAWGTVGLYLVSGTASTIVTFAAQGRSSDAAVAAGWNGSSATSNLVIGTAFLLFPVVGAIVASRRPENWLGRLLVLIGLDLALGQLVATYEVAGIVLFPGALPGARVAAAFDSASWVPMIVLMGVYVLLLFPDGHLPGPRWRPVAWIVGIQPKNLMPKIVPCQLEDIVQSPCRMRLTTARILLFRQIRHVIRSLVAGDAYLKVC